MIVDDLDPVDEIKVEQYVKDLRALRRFKTVEGYFRDWNSIDLQMVPVVVARIAELQQNPEEAHILEDTLYRIVLQTIAGGLPSSNLAAEFAREALKTQKLDLERWYA